MEYTEEREKEYRVSEWVWVVSIMYQKRRLFPVLFIEY